MLITEAASPWEPCSLTLCTAAADLHRELARVEKNNITLVISAQNIVGEERTLTMYVTFM